MTAPIKPAPRSEYLIPSSSNLPAPCDPNRTELTAVLFFNCLVTLRNVKDFHEYHLIYLLIHERTKTHEDSCQHGCQLGPNLLL